MTSGSTLFSIVTVLPIIRPRLSAIRLSWASSIGWADALGVGGDMRRLEKRPEADALRAKQPDTGQVPRHDLDGLRIDGGIEERGGVLAGDDGVLHQTFLSLPA
ncbi:MAG: hypothetical protein FD129_1681 [bacterium]|nr:MAG: hypothetical protein FD129_1681 [bacterium]